MRGTRSLVLFLFLLDELTERFKSGLGGVDARQSLFQPLCSLAAPGAGLDGVQLQQWIALQRLHQADRFDFRCRLMPLHHQDRRRVSTRHDGDRDHYFREKFHSREIEKAATLSKEPPGDPETAQSWRRGFEWAKPAARKSLLLLRKHVPSCDFTDVFSRLGPGGGLLGNRFFNSSVLSPPLGPGWSELRARNAEINFISWHLLPNLELWSIGFLKFTDFQSRSGAFFPNLGATRCPGSRSLIRRERVDISCRAEKHHEHV